MARANGFAGKDASADRADIDDIAGVGIQHPNSGAVVIRKRPSSSPGAGRLSCRREFRSLPTQYLRQLRCKTMQ